MAPNVVIPYCTVLHCRDPDLQKSVMYIGVMYISGRLYSRDPKFWKETLALHCRHGLMFVLKNISVSDCSLIVLIFRAISASMFLLSLFLLRKKSVYNRKHM